MDRMNMVTPKFHVSKFLAEPKYNPRAICRYIHRKKADAPLAWTFRIAHPAVTSREI